ncbi:ATP-binding protein [Nocardia sienata]|uniref:ATP-binding protein n=1 Tax=Nocardia sienata TaxID=248552 RepID=UPI000A07B8E6|nr:ATP-binding protein [Nocardia sienata]
MAMVTLGPVLGAHGGGGPVVELDLKTVTMARVRSEIRRLLAGGSGIEVCDAVQVSDELVSNAVRHARSPRTCRLWVHGRDWFGVEVRDGSLVPARIRTPDQVGGRGLRLVAQLAARWGMDFEDGGKTVWAELGRRATMR